ncbi:putative exosome complex exonuclease rrp40-like protein [Histomonas meleagridis]|uniref:putative exosome complex exonuclease rrp40-like protein n=1 Tax=Histomonas meleagridis TaxID=135588 RepID=UPI0035598A85|nr:putative exosome complex exonuclease rrp40-like protein [Histomonas meleagridis]
MVAAYVEEVPESGEILLNCIPRTNAERLGALVGGSLLRCNPKAIQMITELKLLEKITQVPIRVVFGMNGRIFIDASTAEISERLVFALMVAFDNPDNIVETYENQLALIKFPTTNN